MQRQVLSPGTLGQIYEAGWLSANYKSRKFYEFQARANLFSNTPRISGLLSTKLQIYDCHLKTLTTDAWLLRISRISDSRQICRKFN
jgi:hypothetical protein